MTVTNNLWAVPSMHARTTAQKIGLFREYFTGLLNVYGTYDPSTGRVRQVKQTVSDDVILAHLQGRRPYGVYLLVEDRTRAVVADFDDTDPGPPIDLVRRAQDYGISAYVERSKQKGWHVWVFLELPGVPAANARSVMKLMLDDIAQAGTEVFPKHDRLDHRTAFGSFIHAPLFGKCVPRGRTVFVDVERELTPYEDQWDVLKNVRRTTETQLDELVEINGLEIPAPVSGRSLLKARPTEATYGLPPCAQRMLADGVQEFQRVTCYRLAQHLKKAGIPEEIALAGLCVWATKNRPKGSKRIITHHEIRAQTGCAYSGSCNGCGCEEPGIRPYCDEKCPVKSGWLSSETESELA